MYKLPAGQLLCLKSLWFKADGNDLLDRLGWVPASLCILLFTVLSLYSGALISRLSRAAGGAMLFGDIGEAAAGSRVGILQLNSSDLGSPMRSLKSS